MNKEVKAYFENVPDARKRLVNTLHDIIMECYPQATVDLRYRMPTYSWKDGWVAVANQKAYVSLYTCGAHHLEKFRSEHPDYRTGKGCINFRQRDEIPTQAVREVVRHAIENPKGGDGRR